jgi:hypothetical protein
MRDATNPKARSFAAGIFEQGTVHGKVEPPKNFQGFSWHGFLTRVFRSQHGLKTRVTMKAERAQAKKYRPDVLRAAIKKQLPTNNAPQ